MRVCSKEGCDTILSTYNPGERCSVHPEAVNARYDWAAAKDDWFHEMKHSDVPPKGYYLCADCNRAVKSTTTCVCRATPAPIEPFWEAYRVRSAA